MRIIAAARKLASDGWRLLLLFYSLAVVLYSYDLRRLILSVPITYILSYAPAVSLRTIFSWAYSGEYSSLSRR